MLSLGREDGASGWPLFVAFAVLVLIAVGARYQLEPPSVAVNVDMPASQFSAIRAKQTLSFVLGREQAPHPVDSPADDAVRSRIISVLTGLGYHPAVQDTTSCRKVRVQVCARIRNITAVREGTPGGEPILLVAHYDSVAAGPGASDDGAGVAVLLEVARLLGNRPAGLHPVVLLFTEGEEEGLLGAEAFVDSSTMAGHIAWMINLEARGTSGKIAMFQTGDDSGRLVDSYASLARSPLTSSLLNVVYKVMPNDTDFSVFKDRGVQGLNFAFGEHYAYYHTPRDNLSALSPATLQHEGESVYALLQHLVNADLPPSRPGDGRVYTDIFGKGIVSWPRSWSPWLALFVLVGFILCSWRWWQQDRYGLSSTMRGAAGIVISVVAGSAVGYGLFRMLSVMGDQGVSWHSDSVSNRWLLWCAVLLTVQLAQRWLGSTAKPLGVCVGVIGGWLVLGLFSAIFIPEICYLFLLPGAAATLAMVVLLFAGAFPMRPVLWFLLAEAAAFVVILPVVYLIEIMLGFDTVIGSTCMGALLGLALSLLMPMVVQVKSRFVRRSTGYAVATLTAISGFMSAQAPAYSKEIPQQLNMTYVQFNGSSMLLSGSAFNPPPVSVLGAMGKGISLGRVLPWSSTSVYKAPAPALALLPARLTLVGDTITSKGRQVRVQINGESSIRGLWLLVPVQAGLQSLTLDGHELSYTQGHSRLGAYDAFICHGDSCNGKQLMLELSRREATTILVVKETAFPSQLADITRARDAAALPVNDGDKSLIVDEFSL
jgi:hypothetical protein